MTKKEMRRPNRIWRLSVVIVYLVLITTWISAGLYAKYTVTAEGSDSASVAKWSVFASGDKAALNLDCAKNQENDSYTVTVTNQSEVAVSYDMKVVLEKALPEKITLKLDDGTKIPTKSSDGKTYQFSQVGELAAGNESKNHSIIFTAASDYAGDEFASKIVVTVDISQID